MKLVQMRAELAAESNKWHTARPRIAGPCSRLKRISARVNWELSRMARLIEAAEDYDRQGRRLRKMLTLARLLAKKLEVRILNWRIQSMVN